MLLSTPGRYHTLQQLKVICLRQRLVETILWKSFRVNVFLNASGRHHTMERLKPMCSSTPGETIYMETNLSNVSLSTPGG
ncbi:hypothetical protein RRG08_004980 [Elysia crispata]|uniref:Uncharacterized protein n=1 Tax=Elysia crispata TaxID=231223 RepID=A0AAE0XUX3_9GAST|nr:hypothetical protein RRG08_004980 [Elysia crispata]